MAVLLFITSLVIFVFHFMPAPKIARFESGLDQAPIQGQAQNLTISPNDRSVKIRRKVSYLSPPSSPSVQTSRPIHDRDAQLIRRVLVPKLFSYAVVQQPESNPYYVSSSKELVTEFSLAREFNNIGLLAHNNLAGKSFKHLKPGQDIYVVHKNGHTDRYIVSNIYRFQALESTNTGSRFVDLDTGENLTANEVFTKMYTGVPHLTFQTCIYAEGDSSWGRLFVIAVPDEDTN
jgi:hypothetical protein